MKRIIALLTTAVMLLAFAGCGANSTQSQAETETKAAASTKVSEATKAADETKAESNDTESSSKTLVVYFSATGTTKGVAEQIASALNADTYEITAAQPYTSDDLNYSDSNSRTTKEQNDKTVRPEIGSEKTNLDGYDTIFIGFPIWWGEEPRIMDTFVESYDFSGKTMIPFCTSGGSGIGSSGDNLKANAGSGEWKDGARLSGSDVQDWLDGLNLKE
ncbi:MAG: flavodoxin [Ruminococcus sp.]|nr:flavodoxin [Ruminococcus sp.]